MRTISISVVFLPALLLIPVAAIAGSPDPEVTIRYSAPFDSACAEVTKQAIEPEAVKELQSRLESFRALWRKAGPELLGAVPPITGVPFRFSEAIAVLILCPGFPPMSAPLMVNMRMYLSSTGKDKTAPLIDFGNTLFHEVLHRYVGDWLATMPGRTTPLLSKYKSEPAAVLSHLHLYAIERLAYRKLEREQDLDVSVAAEQIWNNSVILKRAREIVAKEGAESFVQELRVAAR
jgi:hypothetical protein